MPESRGEPEPMHILPEFACQAIPEPGLFPPGTVFGVGVNEGMHMLDEVVVDLRGTPPAPASVLDGLPAEQQAALRSLVADGSVATVARALGVTPPQAREVLLAAVEALRTRLAG